MKKWINIDHAPNDWINQDDIPARQLIPGAVRITLAAIIALSIIIFLES